MISIYRTAAITLVCTMALVLVIHWPDYAVMNAPAFIGSFIGTTVGMWGLSGAFMLFAKRESKIWVWLTALVVMAGLIWYQQLEQRKEGWKMLPNGVRYLPKR